MLKTIFFLSLLITSVSAFSQTEEFVLESPSHFALFIVEGFTTPQEARAIDAEMRTLSGVIVSRMDIPTHRYFIVFDPNTTYDQDWFNMKFLTMGDYSIHCYQEGVHGVDEFVPITKDDCTELN